MNNYLIKNVYRNDFEHCAKVIRQGFASLARNLNITKDNFPQSSAFTTTDRLVHESEQGNLMYSIYDNSKIVGFIELEKNDNLNYILKKHTVLFEKRHAGYGKALLDFAKNKVKEMGGEKLMINVIENNDILKDWYKSNGFDYIGKHNSHNAPFEVGIMESSL